MNTELRIGDRVEMINCHCCAYGTVIGYSRNRIMACFDDQPGTKWLLRPDSLRLVGAEAQGGLPTKATPHAPAPPGGAVARAGQGRS